MANYEARLARLEQQASVGVRVTIVGATKRAATASSATTTIATVHTVRCGIRPRTNSHGKVSSFGTVKPAISRFELSQFGANVRP